MDTGVIVRSRVGVGQEEVALGRFRSCWCGGSLASSPGAEVLGGRILSWGCSGRQYSGDAGGGTYWPYIHRQGPPGLQGPPGPPGHPGPKVMRHEGRWRALVYRTHPFFPAPPLTHNVVSPPFPLDPPLFSSRPLLPRPAPFPLDPPLLPGPAPFPLDPPLLPGPAPFPGPAPSPGTSPFPQVLSPSLHRAQESLPGLIPEHCRSGR